MITNALQRVFNTRPNQEEIEFRKQRMETQSRETVKSLKKVDKVLKNNLDITHTIAIAMGIIKYAR